MIAYPVILTPDSNGTLLVTSPDFPELTSFGETLEDALEQARGALSEVIAARIYEGAPIPEPSTGRHMVELPNNVAGVKGACR